MIDKEKVIDHLKIIRVWNEVGKAYTYDEMDKKEKTKTVEWIDDALELLKEQEIKEQTSDIIHESTKQFMNKETGWIDVAEKLPMESDGYVLVCMPDEFPYNQRQRVRLGQYSEYAHQWFFEGGAVGGSDPIAWKPLPEPIYDNYEKGFNDAMLGKQELMYEGEDGKWYKKDW